MRFFEGLRFPYVTAEFWPVRDEGGREYRLKVEIRTHLSISTETNTKKEVLKVNVYHDNGDPYRKMIGFVDGETVNGKMVFKAGLRCVFEQHVNSLLHDADPPLDCRDAPYVDIQAEDWKKAVEMMPIVESRRSQSFFMAPIRAISQFDVFSESGVVCVQPISETHMGQHGEYKDKDLYVATYATSEKEEWKGNIHYLVVGSSKEDVSHYAKSYSEKFRDIELIIDRLTAYKNFISAPMPFSA